MNKKNIIIIMIDGGRYDYAKNSDYFNKIKKQSVHFSQSITYAPHTIAAMHAVFSGCYGSRTGTDSYWTTYNFDSENFKTITEYLKENDYFTQCDLINELIIPKQGFDVFSIHDENKDNLVERHTKILENMKTINQTGKKFFLYLHFSNIHTGIKNEVLNVYHNHSEEFFENIDTNKKRYTSLFKNAEQYLDLILNEIKKLELDENSLVLIMSDHGVSTGERFGEHAYGAFCYDYTLKTMTYFLNSNFEPIEISQQIRLIDFMPTILNILDISLDSKFEKLDGCSLLPLFKKQKMDELTAISQTGNPLKNKRPPEKPNVHSIRTSKWKLIYNQHDDTKELYDLSDDLTEKNNLISLNNEIEETLWKELKQQIKFNV
tara:strand:- start:1581 stop:2708 length:1128 start_codon:yes stop_codon:yes gene_type:complete